MDVQTAAIADAIARSISHDCIVVVKVESLDDALGEFVKLGYQTEEDICVLRAVSGTDANGNKWHLLLQGKR
jgi:hypothetical protein